MNEGIPFDADLAHAIGRLHPALDIREGIVKEGHGGAFLRHEDRSPVGIESMQVFDGGGIAHLPGRLARKERGAFPEQRIPPGSPEIEVTVRTPRDRIHDEFRARSFGKIVEIMERVRVIVGCSHHGTSIAVRERLAGTARLSVASPRLNTDNAAMIAAVGAWHLARGERSGWDLEPRDDLPIPGLQAATPSHRTSA